MTSVISRAGIYRKPCGSVCGTINPREVETTKLSLTLLKTKIHSALQNSFQNQFLRENRSDSGERRDKL